MNSQNMNKVLNVRRYIQTLIDGALVDGFRPSLKVVKRGFIFIMLLLHAVVVELVALS